MIFPEGLVSKYFVLCIPTNFAGPIPKLHISWKCFLSSLVESSVKWKTLKE